MSGLQRVLLCARKDDEVVEYAIDPLDLEVLGEDGDADESLLHGSQVQACLKQGSTGAIMHMQQKIPRYVLDVSLYYTML